MPSVPTIINDLYLNQSKSVTGWGMLGTVAPDEQATLSGMFRVTQKAKYTTMAIGAAPDYNATRVAAPKMTANSVYLFFEDDWSTLATLTRSHRIAAGGGYSGCLYSVYNAGGGEFKCIHTARPNGANADLFVTGIRAYAADKRWTLVHEIPTVADALGGAGVNGCVTTFLVTDVNYTSVPNPTVRTVRLRQNAQGRSVGQDKWETPT